MSQHTFQEVPKKVLIDRGLFSLFLWAYYRCARRRRDEHARRNTARDGDWSQLVAILAALASRKDLHCEITMCARREARPKFSRQSTAKTPVYVYDRQRLGSKPKDQDYRIVGVSVSLCAALLGVGSLELHPPAISNHYTIAGLTWTTQDI